MVWSKTDGGPYFVPFDVTNRDMLRETLQELASEMHPVTESRSQIATQMQPGKIQQSIEPRNARSSFG